MKKIKLSIAGLLLSGLSYGQNSDTLSFYGQETSEVKRIKVEEYVMLDNDTIVIPYPYNSMNIQTSPGLNDAAVTGNTEWLIDEDYKAIRISKNKYKIVSGCIADECVTLKHMKITN